MLKGNVATAGISFTLSGSRFHVPISATSDVRGMTVCFAMGTLYLQKRDEWRGVNHLVGTNGDPARGDIDGTSGGCIDEYVVGKKG